MCTYICMYSCVHKYKIPICQAHAFQMLNVQIRYHFICLNILRNIDMHFRVYMPITKFMKRVWLIVQAICAKKPPNRAKLSTSMKLTTMIIHRMETNFRYGATKKCRYFHHGSHICSAITAFLIFGHISITNWLMTTKLVSNTMFSGSWIPMKQSKT